MPDLVKAYKDILSENGWDADAYQNEAVVSLQRFLQELSIKKSFWPFQKEEEIKGVYLYGGVGRGKSMLMDLFFKQVPDTLKKRRTHFHEFMIETHDWLHAHRGEGMDDLLPRYVDHLADNVKLLCFDEFHVTDVADAMILGRLFTEAFERGIIMVSTSNWAPKNLYEGGLQRDLFVPFINLLKEKMDIIHLDSDTDYRTTFDPSQDAYYFYPLDKATKDKADKLFSEFSNGKAMTQETLKVKGRDIPVKAADYIARFTFSEICEKAYGAEDYITIAEKYDTIFIENIPRLHYDRRNEAKRLILLIDCLYEAKCRVVISAQDDIDALYQVGDHAFEFERTVSRLMEMQSNAYHEARA